MRQRVSGIFLAMGTVVVLTGMSALVMMLVSGAAFGTEQKLIVAALTLAGAITLVAVRRHSLGERRRSSLVS